MIPRGWPYSPQTYEAFTAVKNAGFAIYCCGQRHAPHVLVAAYRRDTYIDIINVRDVERVTAARLPTHDGIDIFAPDQAVWHYMGNLEQVVAAILRLPPQTTQTHPLLPTQHH